MPQIVRYSLDEVTIRGADSIDSALMWLSDNQPFLWGCFWHNGDSAQSRIPLAAICFECRPKSSDEKAYLEVVYGGKSQGIYEIAWNTAYEGWKRIATSNVSSPGRTIDIEIPEPDDKVVKLVHRERCGKKKVWKKSDEEKELSIGDSNLELRIVPEVGIQNAHGLDWRGMDFLPGEAKDNFDNVCLLHEASKDYIEFKFNSTGGEHTISANIRKITTTPLRAQVKVGGKTKFTGSIDDMEDIWDHHGWADLWTGEIPEGEHVIRVANAEPPDSNMSIGNDKYGKAIMIRKT